MSSHENATLLEQREDPASQPRPATRVSIARAQWAPIAAATVVLFAVAALAVPASVTRPSLLAMAVPAAIMAVAACGQTFVVQQKGIDLSVGGAISFAAVTVGALGTAGASVGLSLIVVAALAALFGLVNGVLVTWLNVTPIIATLALNSVIVGAVWTVSGGNVVRAPAALQRFASASYLGLPVIIWMALALVLVVGVFMWKTKAGRRFAAVGASPLAARASGVRTGVYVVAAYVGSGLLSAAAGVLIAGYVGSGSYGSGVAYTLPVIAAVVVGGTSLSGGRGSVVASALGSLFLSFIVQIVLTLGAPTSAQLLLQTLALAVAAMMRSVPWSRIVPWRRGRSTEDLRTQRKAGT